MKKIQIKPISVNRAWKGRRFKTQEYKNFEDIMMWLLPKLKIPQGKLEIDLKFGMSSKTSDLDNPVKQTLDCLQWKYGFNDKMIFKMLVEKEIVKKGEEYIGFEIRALNKNENKYNNTRQRA